jgi:hypothetical protein
VKRYDQLRQTQCICGKFLCVMAFSARFTGEVRCRYCGANHIFNNGSKPVNVERKALSAAPEAKS